MGGKSPDNPAPGTVLDHTVTKRDWFDFFLVSQHVGQVRTNEELLKEGPGNLFAESVCKDLTRPPPTHPYFVELFLVSKGFAGGGLPFRTEVTNTSP